MRYLLPLLLLTGCTIEERHYKYEIKLLTGEIIIDENCYVYSNTPIVNCRGNKYSNPVWVRRIL